MPQKKCCVWLALMLPFTSAFAQANWPQFRGELSSGIATNKNLPTTWSTNQNVAWKTEIPSWGWSSPIVWGEKIFVTSVIKEGPVETPKKGLYFGGERPTPTNAVHRWMVDCLDWRTGKTIWEKQVHQGIPTTSIHLKNTYASETPVIDGERLYAYFGNVGLFCFDMEGKELWSQKWGPFKT